MPDPASCTTDPTSGRTGMRYRTICPKKGHATFYTSSRGAPSISQQLADVLAEVFRGSTASYRLVGHSLGTQVRPSPMLFLAGFVL